MKTLIVYYSLEGNTQYIAESVAEQLGAHLLRLVPKKAYANKGLAKFFWGGRSALMAEMPELESYDVNLVDYDQIIIGFPVWAGTITPPIRTFVSEHLVELKEKKLACYACQSGAGAEKAFGKLKDLIGVDDFSATAIFIDPKVKPSDANTQKLEEFCKKLKEV